MCLSHEDCAFGSNSAKIDRRVSLICGEIGHTTHVALDYGLNYVFPKKDTLRSLPHYLKR